MVCYKTPPINNYNGWEENVGNLLSEYNGKGIQLFKADRGAKDREYFICENDDLITQEILPKLKYL